MLKKKVIKELKSIEEVMYMFAKGVRYKKEGCQEVEDMWEMHSRLCPIR